MKNRVRDMCFKMKNVSLTHETKMIFKQILFEVRQLTYYLSNTSSISKHKL